jgi:hypothetical protein
MFFGNTNVCLNNFFIFNLYLEEVDIHTCLKYIYICEFPWLGNLYTIDYENIRPTPVGF